MLVWLLRERGIDRQLGQGRCCSLLWGSTPLLIQAPLLCPNFLLLCPLGPEAGGHRSLPGGSSHPCGLGQGLGGDAIALPPYQRVPVDKKWATESQVLAQRLGPEVTEGGWDALLIQFWFHHWLCGLPRAPVSSCVRQ